MKLERCKTNDFWAVREDNGVLIFLIVYKVGGEEVIYICRNTI